MKHPLLLCSASLALATTVFPVAGARAEETVHVVSQTPAANALTSWPKQIQIVFNAPVKMAGLDVQLMDPDGRRIRTTSPLVSGDSLTVTPMLSDGPPVLGPYMLTWQADAASGPAAKGDYTFFVQ